MESKKKCKKEKMHENLIKETSSNKNSLSASVAKEANMPSSATEQKVAKPSSDTKPKALEKNVNDSDKVDLEEEHRIKEYMSKKGALRTKLRRSVHTVTALTKLSMYSYTCLSIINACLSLCF